MLLGDNFWFSSYNTSRRKPIL